MKLNDADRAKLFEAAKRREFPAVEVRPGETLPGGETAWHLLAFFASAVDLKGAAAGLRKIPAPKEGTP